MQAKTNQQLGGPQLIKDRDKILNTQVLPKWHFSLIDTHLISKSPYDVEHCTSQIFNHKKMVTEMYNVAGVVRETGWALSGISTGKLAEKLSKLVG